MHEAKTIQSQNMTAQTQSFLPQNLSKIWIQLQQILGSIKLAVPLLASIIGVLIWATFYESQVGSPTVQQVVYKSPWFGALMFLLALNLSVSALSRYPWRGPRKVGFALTHFGLVVLIAGSAAVIHISTEGMLLIRTDQGANSLVRVEGELLDVVGPDQAEKQVNLFIKPDNTVSPSEVGGLKLLRYAPNTVTTTRFEPGGPVANAAVKLQLQSDRMGQTLERWLAIAPAGYSDVSVGPATLELRQANTDTELEALLAQPQPQLGGRFGSLQLGENPAIDVEGSLDKIIDLANGLQLRIDNFWPDFRLDSENRPESASDQLNNPAMQLSLRLGRGEAAQQERWFIFANGQFDPIRTSVAGAALDRDALGLSEVSYDVQPPAPEDYFRVVMGPEGERFYAANSSKGFKSGPLEAGEAVTPGWADFRISVAEAIADAQVQREVVEVPEDENLEGEPALLVAMPDGSEQWLPWGDPVALSNTSGDYYAAFSPRMLQLPFGIKLEDFIVERNEGSESVAMWTSQIRLDDPHQGVRESRRVWMNHPTWYQGWKIAQASWNPGDLNQSTLQVKLEPWWVTGLTWLGSLMVVVGTAVIFYGRSAMKNLKAVLPEPGQEESSDAEPPEMGLAARL